MRSLVLAFGLLATAVGAGWQPQQPARPLGTRLSDIAWPEAEGLLRPDAVVVIPLGAGSKEHGPHLKLGNDLTLAEYLTTRIAAAAPVVIAPTVPYHFYPAFLEYPGSTSLNLDTARTMMIDVVRSLAHYGPRRFYVLNTGISTLRALEPAARTLADEGVLLGYTDLAARTEPAASRVRRQEGGTHADEIETSMMLYVDPSSVDMRLARKDYAPSTGALKLTRQRGGAGTYSATGIWGDPTLASRDKGQIVVEALVAGILDDIEKLRHAPLPAPAQPAAPARDANRTGAAAAPPTCSAGDERSIRAIGGAYSTHWANADAQRFSELWTEEGDMIHPDGTTERTRQTIFTNRVTLFQGREYRGSKYFVTLFNVRCLTPDIAIADGRWELRGVNDADGKVLPSFTGQCTLVVQRLSGWLIEAYRYTLNPTSVVLPTWLKRPGWPGRQGH